MSESLWNVTSMICLKLTQGCTGNSKLLILFVIIVIKSNNEDINYKSYCFSCDRIDYVSQFLLHVKNLLSKRCSTVDLHCKLHC